MHIFSVLEKLLQEKKEVEIKNTEITNKDKTQRVDYQENNNLSTNSEKKKFQSNSQSKNFEKKKFENISKSQPKQPSNSCYALFPKDGDTFVGMYNNEKRTFRLAGINTPEKGAPWAKQATDFLREKIGKKVVYLEILGKDPYDRDIVEVYLDKEKTQHVNKMLLDEGLATSERYTNTEGDHTHNIIEYIGNEIEEKIAQISGDGMWSGEPPEEKVSTPKKVKFGRRS